MSCLFNSLSYFLNQNSYEIRQTICNYLQNNGNIMDGLETKDILEILEIEEGGNNYINNMRSPSTWGGAVEIQSACNIWNLKIIVKNIRDIDRNSSNSLIEFIPLHNNINKTIYLEWSGGHYEPIRN